MLNNLENQQISTESDNENFDINQIQNNKNKRKSDENKSSDIDVGDGGSKRTRWPPILFQDHYALNTRLEIYKMILKISLWQLIVSIQINGLRQWKKK